MAVTLSTVCPRWDRAIWGKRGVSSPCDSCEEREIVAAARTIPAPVLLLYSCCLERVGGAIHTIDSAWPFLLYTPLPSRSYAPSRECLDREMGWRGEGGDKIDVYMESHVSTLIV